MSSPPIRKSARSQGTLPEKPSQRKSPQPPRKSSRNSPPKKRATLDDLLGAAAYSQEPVGTGQEVIDLSSEVAAAATTSVYQSQYGGGNVPSPARTEASNGGSDKNSSNAAASSSTADGSEDGEYKPDGLVFSDDEDFLVDVDSESEDEQRRSSFPKDKRRKNLIPGGPQPPDLSNYPESERKKVWDDYVAKRKKYTDGARHNRVMKNRSIATSSSKTFLGCQNEQLRPISEPMVLTLLLENTRFLLRMPQLQMGTCRLLLLVCYLVMRTPRTGLSFGGLSKNIILVLIRPRSPS